MASYRNEHRRAWEAIGNLGATVGECWNVFLRTNPKIAHLPAPKRQRLFFLFAAGWSQGYESGYDDATLDAGGPNGATSGPSHN